MRKSLFFYLILLFLTRCSPGDPAIRKTPPPAPGNEQILRGSFKMNAAAGLLSDCNTGKQFTIPAKSGLDSLYRMACGPVTFADKTVYAVLRGQLSGDTLTVKDVDAVEAKNPWNTCIPFEFWCSGTEPFWELEISQAEGALFYEDMGRQQGTKYTWAAPVTKGDTWMYEAPATPDGQPALRIVIKKENANNGMSDLVYHYSAELTVGSEKRKGVAIRWGEPKLEPKN